ncbi:hypothetical protein HDV63DRAFT_71737 [Trichoderma sp. SZMC 28014]
MLFLRELEMLCLWLCFVFVVVCLQGSERWCSGDVTGSLTWTTLAKRRSSSDSAQLSFYHEPLNAVTRAVVAPSIARSGDTAFRLHHHVL